jgi:thiosulfate dehydrogenase (quinone) large subunit
VWGHIRQAILLHGFIITRDEEDVAMTTLRKTYLALFTSTLTAPLWLALRIYLGLVWLRFGVAKIEAGWLTTNQLGGLLRVIADGGTSTYLRAFRSIAALMLELGLDPILSVAIPVFEIAVALAFFAGVLLVPAATAASLLNLNLILFGIASWRFDGRIILLQLLLLAGWRAAGYLGVASLTRGPCPATTA